MTKTEDALLSGKTVDLSTLGLKEAFPRRPSYGTKGAEVILWANYVALTAPPKLVLYRYDISVTPAATGRKSTQIVRLLLNAPELAPYKHDIVSDFKSTLLCRQKFGDQTITVPFKWEDDEEPSSGAVQYQVQLQLTNTLSTSELIEYLTSTNLSAQYDEKLPLMQALNIFLNHYAKSTDNLATIGASKVFSLGANSDTWDLGSGLVGVRGFFASVRAATGRLLVNVNPSHGAFFQEGPLDQFVSRLSFGRRAWQLQNFLKGVRVRTTHLKDKVNKSGKVTYRIKNIAGLANKYDGRNLAHPPRVKAFGSGPKDVEFWLDDKGQAPAASASGSGKKKKGGQGAKPQGAPATGGGQYISVYDFFAKGEQSTIPHKWVHRRWLMLLSYRTQDSVS